MRKIGLFGGSFNPIHTGHLAMARLALDALGLESMVFIPTKDHPFEKETLTVSADHRLAMLELAVASEPKFSISDVEIKREGKSFAIDTIESFQEKYPDAQLSFLIGSDNLPSFHKWHRYETILERVELLVASRPGFTNNVNLPGTVRFFPSPEWGLSSSVVREYLGNNLSCSYLIPDTVLTYIKENNLYNK